MGINPSDGLIKHKQGLRAIPKYWHMFAAIHYKKTGRLKSVFRRPVFIGSAKRQALSCS
jgi:hypothetical protein